LQSQFSLFLCILKPEAYAQKLDRSKTPAQLHIMNWHPDVVSFSASKGQLQQIWVQSTKIGVVYPKTFSMGNHIFETMESMCPIFGQTHVLKYVESP
jgi:hypothetical protein